MKIAALRLHQGSFGIILIMPDDIKKHQFDKLLFLFRHTLSPVLLLLSGVLAGHVHAADGLTVQLPRETFLVYPGRINIPNVYPIVKLDTLQLLNNSRWDIGEMPVPIGPQQALELAVKSIPKNLPKRTSFGLTGVTLKPFGVEQGLDVWYYDVEFLPLGKLKASFDYESMHVAIILMDGTVLTPENITFQELRKIRENCTYVRNGKEWKLLTCK